MIIEPKVSLFDLSMSLSEAIDLISPAVFNHHMGVAYIAYCIAAELKLPDEKQGEIALAGALHDCGGVSMKNCLKLIQFEEVFYDKMLHAHAELGYHLLKQFEPFTNIAPIVRFHHVPWNESEKFVKNNEAPSIESHIIHLADRIAILLKKEKNISDNFKRITGKIKENSGTMFMPELVDAFMKTAAKEAFWLDLTSPAINAILPRRLNIRTIDLTAEKLENLTKLFSRIVDFRSKFTAAHSSGVASVAEAIAKLIGYSQTECRLIKVAGYLHDLGKLAVPTDILEKQANLTEDEFEIIKRHPYYTYRILERMPPLDVINKWASYHHECPDGSGYPFHLKDENLSFESRIMAVAEIFTAVTENLPYREGINLNESMKIIQDKADNCKLDADVVSFLKQNIEQINFLRISAQVSAAEEYNKFLQLAA